MAKRPRATRERVIALLSEHGELSTAELMVHLGYSSRGALFVYTLNKLLEAGTIRRELRRPKGYCYALRSGEART